MTLSKIGTPALVANAVDNTILDLADNFAFTGNVTGAGGQVHLITHTVSDAVAQVIFNETYINSTYDNYLLIAKWFVSADSSKLDFQFRQQDGTAINDSNYIRNIASSTYGANFSTTPVDSAELSQNLGVGGGNRERGGYGNWYLSMGNTQDFEPTLNGTFVYGGTSNSTHQLQGGMRYLGSTAITGGFKLFNHNGSNFTTGSTFSLYGLAT